MRIAYVHNGLFPSNSPGVNFCTHFVQALAKNKHDVTYYVQSNSQENTKNVLADDFALTLPSTLQVERFSPTKLGGHWWFYLRVYHHLLKEHRQKPWQAIVARNHTFLPWLAAFGQKTGVPVFFETHDFYADPAQRADYQPRWQRLTKLERRYLPRLTGLLCLQQAQMGLYRRAIPGLSCHLLRTGAPSLSADTKAERQHIVYVGSLDKHKGLGTVVTSLTKWPKDYHLTILGGKSDAETAPLRALAAKLGVADRVIFTGWLKREALHNMLKQAKLGLLPLEDTFFNRYCTSPLKLFDFFAAGVPVIASDLPTSRELIDDKTGWFFAPEDPDSLAKAINLALSDESLLDQKSQACILQAQKLSWSVRAENFVKIVESLDAQA